MRDVKYPLRRCRLPLTAEITPYLEIIDNTQWYSNFGPLSLELEKRLASKFDLEVGQIQLVSSATTGLYLALAALGLPKGSLCAVPSLTFPATVSAVLLAGLTPLFVDVDTKTLTISIPKLLKLANKYDVSAAIPVSFFGRPMEPEAWLTQTSGSGIRSVFDAAWCFDNLEVSSAPAVVSLHATKSLGIGEGGFVACLNKDLIAKIRMDSNFGLTADRDIASVGLNGKISEYAAAVGLAALDVWESRRQSLVTLQETYRTALASVDGQSMLQHQSKDNVTGSMAILLDRPAGRNFTTSMFNQSIEARYWWSSPCHTMTAFRGLKRSDLSATNDLASRVINLPFYEGLTAGDIMFICDALSKAIKKNS